MTSLKAVAHSSFPTLVAESSAVATVSDHCMLEVPVDISTPMLRVPLVIPHFHTKVAPENQAGMGARTDLLHLLRARSIGLIRIWNLGGLLRFRMTRSIPLS